MNSTHFKQLEKKDIEDIFVLTPLQEGMLFHYLKDPLSPVYFEQLSLGISGEIERHLFEQAWSLVISGNEVLRTVFRWENIEKPLQIILKEHHLHIRYFDFAAMDKKELLLNLEMTRENDRKTGFDLHEVPLRVTLCKVKEKAYEMILSNHHILYDGWSTGIILKEFFLVYEKLSQGKPGILPTKMKFREFIKWLRERQGDKTAQMFFWQNYLGDYEPHTNIPLNVWDNAGNTGTGIVREQLDKELTSEIDEFSRLHRITPAVLFYGAWGLVLAKYGNCSDVLFGTTLSGRSASIAGIENMVGLFINTLPLRVQAPGNKKIKLLLDDIHMSLQEREHYESTSLVDIKTFAPNALFDSIMVIENYPLDQRLKEQTGHLCVNGYSMIEASHYDITFGVTLNNRIELSFEFNKQIMDKESARMAVSHWLNILKYILFHPDHPVLAMDMLSIEEKKKILEVFNNTNVAYPGNTTIHELFVEQSSQTPDAVALVAVFACETREKHGKNVETLRAASLQYQYLITYRQLNEQSDQLVGLLIEKGVLPDMIVAIMMERSIEMVISILGILKSGAAYLPIEPLYPQERIDYMLKDSNARILITNNEKKTDNCQCSIVNCQLSTGDRPRSGLNGCPRRGLQHSNHLAYVIYTSGSTGKPKGVPVEHGSIYNTICWRRKEYNLSPKDQALQLFSFAFDGFFTSFFTPIVSGATVVLPSADQAKDINQIKEIIAAFKITHFICVPSLYRSLLDVSSTAELACLKVLTLAGEQVSPDLTVKSKELNPSLEIVNEYGPTENTVVSTIYRNMQPGTFISIGKPVANVKIYFYDKNNNLVPVGIPGELCISGAGVARGYLNNPELTFEKFYRSNRTNILYKTGDLGRWLPDGNIQFLGRIDEQVKIRGFRIETGEIENQLRRLQKVKDALVVVNESNLGDKYLCAYVVSDAPGNMNFQEYLAQTLPDYMIPSYFIRLDKIPITSNGKVDRKALPGPVPNLGEDYIAPRDELEEKLALIWSDLLGVKKELVGIDSNFFQLGGHSLKVTVLTSKIQKEWHIKIPLAEVFKIPTLREMASFVRKAAKEETEMCIEPVEEREYYELSYAQRRLWVLCQFEEDSTAYNIPAAFFLKGPFKTEAFCRAVQTLVNRHESLRTIFISVDGEPRQKIMRNFKFNLETRDFQDLEANERETRARKFYLGIANEAFDLEKGPLFRMAVIRLEEEKYVLVYNMHHIINDGWSHGIIFNEIIMLYNAIFRDNEPNLPRLEFQYKNYSQWHNRLIKDGYFSEPGKYWLNKFKDKPNGMELPLDHPRKPVQTFNGGRVSFTLDNEKTMCLQQLSLKEDATFFMAILTLLNIILYKYTGQEDIIIGAPIANRKLPELHYMIGFLVNTLVYRNKISPAQTFKTLLSAVKQDALACYEYQDFPFDILVEQLDLDRDLSQSPLFNVMAAYNNTDTLNMLNREGNRGLTLDGITLSECPYSGDFNMSKFDLIFFIDEMENEEKDVLIRIEYNSDLFERSTCERMAANFMVLLDKITGKAKANNFDNDIPISGLNILTEDEYETVTRHFNDTGCQFPRFNLQELFEKQVVMSGDKIAVTYHSENISYIELNKKTNSTAHYLKMVYQVKPNDIIGISMDRSIDMIAVILGVIKSGAAYLAVDPTYPRERVLYILADSGAKLLVVDALRPGLFGDYPGDIFDIGIHREALEKASYINPPVVNCPTDILYVNYTSGSTGTPNGAILSHDCLTNLIQWQIEKTGIDCSARCLQFTSINFCVSFQEIMGTLMSGGELQLIGDIERQDIDYLMDFLSRYRVNILFLPFSYLNFLFNESGRWDRVYEHNLKHIITAGEQLKITLGLKRFLDLNPGLKLHNHYGSTEMHVVTSYTMDAANAAKTPVPPVGKPVANIKIFILDEYLQPVPMGVYGELCVAGSLEILGYIGNKELTGKKLVQCPGLSRNRLYRSGDIGRWLPDGNIELRGRKDFLVKVRGFRVEPGEIESKILSLDKVRECVVVVKEDAAKQKYLAAYVTLNGLDALGIKRILGTYLPQYMIPKIIILDSLPLMPNGKVDREKLPDPLTIDNIRREPALPGDDVERALAQIWSGILGVADGSISVDDNFFELGGHSLKATVMAGQIHKTFHVKLPLAEIFKTPVIRDLAKHIKEMSRDIFSAIEPAEEAEYYPLSPAQKRLYLLNRMDPESTVYHISALFNLEGELDATKLEETFRVLVQRHESFRTSFMMVAGEPVQRIHPEVEFAIEYFTTELCAQVRAFDLAKAALLRVLLRKETDKKHVMLVDMHHIITDGTSLGVLVEEFMALYKGEKPAALRLRYRDFSQWQNAQLQCGAVKQQEMYWTERLAGEIPILDLPYDFTRPGVQVFTGKTFMFTVAEVETRQLKSLALAERMSLFMLLTAVVNIFLAKISSQEHIIIGTSTAGRRHQDLQKIIGMFVNTLPLSNEPLGEKSIGSFLKEVKETILEAFENQDYQFEDLVDKIVVQRNTGRNPLFDVMFTLQNMDIAALEIPGLKLTPHPVETLTSRFDMTFLGVESEEKILFSLEYCTRLFTHETIKRLVRYFKAVIASVLSDRDQRIADIEIMTTEERQRLLIDFNAAETDYPRDKSIHELFVTQVEQSPDRIAIVGSLQQITFGQLNEQTNGLAGSLISRGVRAEDIVGIMADRSIDTLIGILGILKAGGAYLPIGPESPRERIDYMMKDSQAKILISIDEKKTDNCQCSIVNCQLSMSEPRASLHHANLAYILYTSGSTGKPKAVLVEHRNVVRLVKNTNFIEFKPGYRLLQTGALEFDASTFEIWGTLLNGLTLFIALRDDILSPGKLKENINKNDIAIMWLTSSLFNRLCGLDVEIFAGLRYLLAGGDVLAPAYINRVRRRFPHLRIINGYGPTENTTFSTSFEIDGEYRESIPIGKPIAHSSVYIVDKFTNTQPIGAAGELCVGGDGVARGYLNNPELTAEKFELLIMLLKNKSFFGGGRGAAFSKKAPLVYRTGDLARWLPDGNIEFLGRIDQQVKIRGFRVEPGEIEYPLLQHPDIKDAVVVSRQEKGGAIYLCAYMVPIKKDDNQLSVSKLREFLAGKLPPYMIPQYFVQLDGIPLTVNGKIDKRLLPEPDISNIKPDSVYSAPADDMEQLIAGVWQEVLKIDQIGIHDNFFDLGGNSLKIIQVNNKLNEALHIKIPVVTFFQYPTISGLKNFLQNEGWVENKNENTEIQPVSNVDGFAVIGMAGRFPGASNINEYWENIKNGIESISFFNNEELAAQGVPAAMLENPAYVKAKGISSDKDRFDAAFFHYTPQEARIMDPQMRIFHECVWEACEDAGYNPEVYDKPIGLYAGAAYNSGWEAKVKLFAGEDSMSTLEAFQLVNSHFIPTRVSYKLNLKGPAMFVQSGCSTSLNAIHTALNALAAGDCAMALAGGVSLSHDKKAGYLYQEGMILSPDGHCRAFDANAGGTVGGEGAAVVLLKPFAQAAADGDHIYAVVKASAANNDGARKVGFSAPSVEGQGESIAIAFAKAGFPPESITYIETHGTGTTLGDPIELAALKMAFKTSRKGFCALGSVKTNVGHMDSASGAVGFIKTVLALKYKQIPPSLFFETPNLHADLINSPFYINTGLSTWQPGSFPRRAGVSSFGIGGTNVHVVLEEYDYVPNSEGNGYKMLLLSAQSEAALAKMKENLRHFLIVNHDLNLDDIAYTLQVGRKFFSRRWVTICSGREGAIAALASPGIILEGTGETLKQTAQLWLQGQEIAGKKSSAGQTLETPGKPGAPDTHEKRNRVPLPTYPFEVDGRRYWIDGNPFDFKDITETMRDHGEIRKKDIADWFYIPRWLQSPPVPAAKNTRPFRFLVFSNECPLILKLINRLKNLPVTFLAEEDVLNADVNDVNVSAGMDVVIVKKGNAFMQRGDREFAINPQQSADYENLCAELNRRDIFPQRIVHAWNVPGENEPHDPGYIGENFYSLLYLAKAIGKQGFAGDIRIDVLANGIQEITGYEQLNPEKATILGPLKVIPQEYPFIICRSIDIELPPGGSKFEEKLLTGLYNEICVDFDSPDTDIAYRSYHRWIKTYEPIRLEAPAPDALPIPLRKRGVYLVTGGYGNIGFILSGYLAEKLQARLILTGPTPLIPRDQWDHWLKTHDADDNVCRKINQIRQLEALGGDVLVFTADAADKITMARAIQTAEQTFGPINGIIHAAGLIRGKSIACTIAETGETECNLQFRPKIQGVLVLAELFKNKSLDFCILTSSLSPILGGLGFAAYSSASAYMDLFATLSDRAGSTRWLSVNWADWNFQQDKEESLPSSLVMGAAARELLITPNEGIETFTRVLGLTAAPVSQVAISSGDLQARIDRWVKLRSVRRHDVTEKKIKRPELATPYAAPRTDLEKVITTVWVSQFGYEKIGVKDDFFALGGDSLKAITLISKIHKELNARIQLNDFFSGPNIETMALFIARAAKSRHTAVEPVEKKEYYTLSLTQQRLYLLDCLGNLGTAYNLGLAVELVGKLDKERLEQAFTKLIQRHETFRTSFIRVAAEPVQRIYDRVDFAVEILTDPAAPFVSPFDLSKAPLLRVKLLEKEKDVHILIVDLHHIISDGVSHNILINEFMALYEQKSLPPLHLQYKDYSTWQVSQQQTEALKKQETYWLNELGSGVPVLNLPTDYTRPPVFSFEGGIIDSGLTAEETNMLYEITRSEGATLFMGLLAAFNIFLSKLTGQEDITVGTPVAGRGHADLEQIIGMFVNTLVVRQFPLAEQTFREFLRQVKLRTLETFENQDYPFEEVVEKVVKERDTSRNPLFNVMFVLQNIPMDVKGTLRHETLGDLVIKNLPRVKNTVQFDLVFEAIENDAVLNFSLAYCSKLFREETAIRFVGYFKEVMASVFKKPGQKISEIEIIPAAEKKQLLFDFNNTTVSYPLDKTIHQLFAEQAAKSPDCIALHGCMDGWMHDCMDAWMDGEVTRNVSLTYHQLNEQSNRLAGVLMEKGALPGTIVGIILERSIELIIGILGILKAGGAYMPIDPEYPQERIQYMLQDSNAKIFINKSEIRNPKLETNPNKTNSNDQNKNRNSWASLVLNFEYLNFDIVSNFDIRASNLFSSNLAYIIFTSGSTGKPKGVPITHDNICPLFHWGYDNLGIGSKDRVLQNLAYYFDWSVWEIFITLTTGAALYIVSRELVLNAVEAASFMKANHITVLHITPTQYQYFIGSVNKLETLRYLFLGAEKLSADLLKRSLVSVQEDCRVFNMYGPTEATIISAVLEIKRGSGIENKFEMLGSVPIGRQVANSLLLIFDRYFNLCPVKVMGELYIGGDGIALGYLNRPELTHKKFKIINYKLKIINGSGTLRADLNAFGDEENFHHSPLTTHHSPIYKTGDLARWLPDGNIEFLGRIDHQVKIRGFRIELDEIANCLQGHGGIKDVIVTVITSESGDKYICAYIIPKNNVSTSELKEYLTTLLPAYMMPTYFIFLDKFPLTANGKIDRLALPKPDNQSPGIITAPRDALEEKLARLWNDVLGRKKMALSIDDNFFELGGYSLKASILTAKIHNELGFKIPLTTMFQAPTIRGLSGYLKNLGKGNEPLNGLKPFELREYYPASSAQKRMFIMHQLEPGSTVYHLPMVLKPTIEIQPGKLTNIFKRLIQRHESLRTSFTMMNGEPVQRIHHDVNFNIDICKGDPQWSPFDLSKAPLFRVTWLEKVGNEFLLAIDMHHIITDGLSQAILINEFSTLYDQGNAELPLLPFQYKEYAQWQIQEAQTEGFKKQKEYWLHEFSGEIPVLDLPCDFPRPPVQSFTGHVYEFEILQAQVSHLKRIEIALGITPFIMFLTAFNILLAKISGQEDIIVGSDNDGRSHADFQNIVGMFVNNLALRNYPTGTKTIHEFILEVKNRTLHAFENRDYQFQDLVQQVAVARDAGRNPLFDVLFSFVDFAEKPGLHILEIVPAAANISMFDLSLYGKEIEGRRVFTYEYCTKLFKEETIERFAGYFQQIITAIIKDRDIPVSEIEIISPAEKEQILFVFNNTKKTFAGAKYYPAAFAETAAREPGKIAAVYNDLQVSYRELDERTQNLAQQLKNHGFGPGHFAALCLERGLAFLTAIIAVFKAGGAYLPIDPEYPQERIQYMLQDSKAKIIVDSEFLTDAPQAPFLQHSAFITQHSNHLAYLIYTSGTTGEPKGVMIHHAGMMNHLYAKIDALGIGREDILAQTASACFDISVWQFLAALLTGGTTCIISKEIVLDAPRFLLALQRKQITILESVPSLITAFLESVTQKTPGTDYSLNSLRWMIPTGEPLTVSLARNWCRHYPHVKMVNAYGPTEASDDITHYTVMEMPSENQQTIPIGKPLPNLHIYILDRYLKLCPIGIRGEICVAGIGVGKGYWQDPIKTARAFVPNPFAAEINDPDYNTLYKTGDIGYYRPDGNIECLGRLDYQVKIRGYRIELGEIEQALLRHESIKEAAVIDLAHQDGSKYLCAYVTWQEGEGFNEQTGLDKLKSGLSRLLPGYMIPAYFVSLTSIPHTANGKVDRKALPRPQLQPHEPGIATQDPIQEIVANIWRDILEMGPVLPGTHADFFTVGGDSIKAIRVVNAVHKQLNARISIRDIFQFPTIAGLAGLIRENTHTPFHEITPLPPQEHYELSYAQKRLWVLQKRAPESQAFNMPEKVTLFEPVSEPLLRRVLELVTSRHESLRTYFTEIDGRIVQKIAPTVTVDIETLDLSHLEGELQTEQRNRLLTGESHIPFNLEIPPLLRIKLIKCRDNEFDLIYTMHHLVSDGWSLDVLRKEFINYYEALKQGRELSLPPARIRYVDYAHWHNRLLEDKDKLKQAREAWQKILLNPLPVLNLPYDFDPGKGKETGKTSSGYRFQVGMETLEKLRSTAANAHASLFMVLLSAFNLLLAQVGEQDDIVIGMPGAARPHEDVKNTIGLFVNTLVVLTKINKEETFNQLLAQVQTATLEILEYQDYPLELICDELNIKYPTIRAFFNMDNTGDTGTMELPPGLTPGHLGQVQDAKFDIVLYLQDFKNGIDIVCNYFTGLFLPETIEKVMTKYIRLLEKIALDPGKPVTEYKTETKKRLLRGNQ